MQLTVEQLSEWCGQPAAEITDLNLSSKELTDASAVASCTNLRKLNLSKNNLTTITGVRDLSALTWLNLSQNVITAITGVDQLKKLNVLNLSNNELTTISSDIEHLEGLKALILNNNKIGSVQHLEKLTQLNTLVLSHNHIKTMPSLPTLTQLTKFSAAHNEFTTIPDFSVNPALKELRMNDNGIAKLPDTLRNCSSVEILDLGNNQLAEWSGIAALGSLTKLTNLNLKGNPLVEKDGYREKILKLVPSLRVLDGQRFDPKFLERKKKHEANLNIVEKKQRLKREKQLKKDDDGGAIEGKKDSGETISVEKQQSRGTKRTLKGAPTEQVVAKKMKKEGEAVKPSEHGKASSNKGTKRANEDHVEKKPGLKKVKVAAAAAGSKKDERKIAAKTSAAAAAANGDMERKTNKRTREDMKTKKRVAGTEEKESTASSKKDSFFLPKEEEPAHKGDIEANEKQQQQAEANVKGMSKAVRQKSGVVGIVDKTKAATTQRKTSVKGKKNGGSNADSSKDDVVSLLESAAQKEKETTGTGLDVGGWDD
ncbi:hypothetical protein BX666DRAFT_1061897 [Dichotomocladium elegans]|nr:hypothetical protein BX666DRAFT_1061897 [Dichotomocladium elegans]